MAALDLVRRYGDRWERPLSLQPGRPRAGQARLPGRPAGRGPARRVPGAAALPRAPGHAGGRCRYEHGFPPPAGRRSPRWCWASSSVSLCFRFPSPVRSAATSVTGSGRCSAPARWAFRCSGPGLALAGFDRLGNLDMKRSAVLIIGLSLLIPYLVGVMTHVGRTDLDIDVAQRGFAARVVGVLPGFFAETISGKGRSCRGGAARISGALRADARHIRLASVAAAGERRDGGTAGQRGSRDSRRAQVRSERRTSERRSRSRRQSPADPAPVSSFLRPSEPRPRKEKKPRKAPPATRRRWSMRSRISAGRSAGHAASDQDVDAGEAQLDRLGKSLIETLRTFKVEGRPGPRTTGPVVTQFEVVPAPGVKAGRIGCSGRRPGHCHAGSLGPGGSHSREGRGGRRDSQPHSAHRHAAGAVRVSRVGAAAEPYFP